MTTLPDIKTILYATDLGDNTRPVFRSALSIARKFDAKIIMLHVVEPMSSAMQAVVDIYLPKKDAEKVYRDEMKEVLTKMKARLHSFCEEELNTHSFKTVHVSEMLVVAGRKSEEIIKAAEKMNSDLIVIGKSTRNILGTDVAGSAARRVSRHSSVPVLVVPNT